MNTDELIRKFTPKVHAIAARVNFETRCMVPRNDLIQAGFVALIEAASRFDDSKNCSLSTFVCLRIRGAIIDEIRRYDRTTRAVRRFQREKKKAVGKLLNQLGRKPSGQEIADAMGSTLAEYRRWNNTPCITELSVSDTDDEHPAAHLIPVSHDNPADKEDHRRSLSLLRESIKALPEKELKVIRYVLSGLPLETIRSDLKVSESRISQIRKSAIKRLRKSMGEAS